jgi:hypothetical protein
MAARRCAGGGTGRSFEPASPQKLFTTKIGTVANAFSRQQYVVTGDGQRFLLNTPSGDPVTTPITLILNWQP